MGHVDVAYQKRHCHAFPCDSVCYDLCLLSHFIKLNYSLNLSANIYKPRDLYRTKEVHSKNSCVDTHSSLINTSVKQN